MTLLFVLALILSFVATFTSDLKYSGAIVFSVTLICVTVLLVTGIIN